MSDSEDELENSESDGDEDGYSSSDLEMNDDFSDHSFSSDTDSDPEPDTCSSINTYSQASSVGDDGDFWSDDLHDVDVTDFDEETGPRHDLQPTANVLMFFFLMFSEEFFSKLAAETNKYSSQQRQQVPDGNWVDTTIPEMMAFIGLQILMGIVQMPSIEMYWSKNIFIGNAGFQNTMSRNRFQALQRYFHVNDNEARIPQGEQGYDRLHKIRPLIDMVRTNFKQHYLPGQHQAIDEGMIKYKGRFYAKQYMPGKPVKRGLKVWMRCEKSGYCGDFLPYLGKHDNFHGRDLGERVVRHLCRPLKHKGHCVYFDRFFTSLRLVRTLEFSGIYSCGTIKQTSRDVPEDLQSPSRLQRGDVMQKQHGNLVLTAWKDKKLVHVLSSGCDPLGDDPVVRRVPGGDAVEITRPPTVTSYQKYMSGVDRCMQHRAKNPVGRPCKKYWKYLMNFILEVCLINAYQIWKETPETLARKKSYKLLDFRTDVSMALIGPFQRFQKTHQVPQQRPGTMHTESRLLRKRSICKWCTRQGEKRRKETVYGCQMCDLHLCKGDCFVSYHRQKNLPIPN